MANPKLAKTSSKLIEQWKEKRFREIFELLDSDGDGHISAQKIDISILTPEMLEIFTPLFCEMEELGQSLDLDEFIDASKWLYQTLTVPDKDLILAVKDKWMVAKAKNQEVFSFHPNLDKKSLKIAEAKRPHDDVADILFEKHRER